MKLSKNFSVKEFTTSAGMVIVPTDEQIFCLRTLCNNLLQPIRDEFGSVNITSGLRNLESYHRLITQGYPASKTSDHFAWCTANPKGTGAADIHVAGTDTECVFNWIIDNLYAKIRQVIYYPNKNIVHVSNSFENIFAKKDSMEKKRRVMIYKNGKYKPHGRRPVPSGFPQGSLFNLGEPK